MINKTLNALKNNVWKTVTIAVTIFTVIGGVWALEDRYANKGIVLAAMNNLQTQQESFQDQQKTFQESQNTFVQQQKINYLRSRLEMYQESLEQVRYDREIVIKRLQENPNNLYYREKKEYLDRKEIRLMNKIDSVMEDMGSIE